MIMTESNVYPYRFFIYVLFLLFGILLATMGFILLLQPQYLIDSIVLLVSGIMLVSVNWWAMCNTKPLNNTKKMIGDAK